MNFNNSATPPTAPPPKENKTKTIVIFVIAAVLGVIGALVIFHYVMVAQDNMDRLFSSSPSSSSEGIQSLTVDQITNMCTEKLRDMLDAEPPKLSVNVCVGTLLGEMNK